MANMQGTGRVGADEFHLYFSPSANVLTSVGSRISEYLHQSGMPRMGIDKEIDKAGSRNLHLLEQTVPILQVFEDLSSNFKRFAFQMAGQTEGNIGCVIAVFRDFRNIELDGELICWQLPVSVKKNFYRIVEQSNDSAS